MKKTRLYVIVMFLPAAASASWTQTGHPKIGGQG